MSRCLWSIIAPSLIIATVATALGGLLSGPANSDDAVAAALGKTITLAKIPRFQRIMENTHGTGSDDSPP
jgi:hypothetical protein